MISGSLAPGNAELRAKRIAHDREQPRFQPGASIELVEIGQRFREGFLHEIVGVAGVSMKRACKCTKGRNKLYNFVLQIGVLGLSVTIFLLEERA